VSLELYYDTATDRAALDAHLATCAPCRARLEEVHDRLRDLPCHELVELVTDYLDEAVDARLRARIDDHLRLCEGCRSYLDEMRATLATLGRIPRDMQLPDDVRAALIAVFRALPRPPEDRDS
jgi:predicted anti-sigma-YlaC factor YlaD